MIFGPQVTKWTYLVTLLHPSNCHGDTYNTAVLIISLVILQRKWIASKRWKGFYSAYPLCYRLFLVSFNKSQDLQNLFERDSESFQLTDDQWRIQPVSLGEGAISVVLGSQVSLRVHSCKRHEVYTSQHCCDKTVESKIAFYR